MSGGAIQDQIKDEWVEAAMLAYQNAPGILLSTALPHMLAAVAPLIRAEAEAGHHLLGNIERQAQTIAELRAEIERLRKQKAAHNALMAEGAEVIAALRADLAQAQAQIEALRKENALVSDSHNWVYNEKLRLENTLQLIADMGPATAEMTLAHEMAQIAHDAIPHKAKDQPHDH